MATSAERTETRSTSLAGRPLRFFLTIFVPLLGVYLATATWTPPIGADTFTNLVTSNELATNGDVYLEEHEELAVEDLQGALSWIVLGKEGAVSQYPPGAAILAVPLYAIWPTSPEIVERATPTGIIQFPLPDIVPGAITAAFVTALGVALLGLALRDIAEDKMALLGAFTVGLATGVWSVAADKLWLHTADVLYLGAATWLAARFYLASGLSFGMAVLTRPHTALIAAGAGIGRSLQTRSWRPAALIGTGAGLGLIALLAYNLQIFGELSLSGGYGFESTSFLTGRVDLIPNFLGALVDPARGLLVYSPFLIALVPGLKAAWDAAPGWVRGSALGGLGYLIVQLASNRFSGGSGFWGYRYPIEFLMATAPLLLLAYTRWVAERPRAKRVFLALLVISIQIHAIGALVKYGCGGELCL